MEDLRAAGGAAGQQAFLFISHQPLVAVGSHVTGHMLLRPSIQPGLKAPVQPSVDTLMGLMSPCQCSVSVHIVFRFADIDHLVGVEFEHTLHLQFAAAILQLL